MDVTAWPESLRLVVADDLPDDDPDDEPPTTAELTPLARVAFGVISRAMADANRGDREARQWVLSPAELTPWAQLLGTSTRKLAEMARRSLPEAPSPGVCDTTLSPRPRRLRHRLAPAESTEGTHRGHSPRTLALPADLDGFVVRLHPRGVSREIGATRATPCPLTAHP